MLLAPTSPWVPPRADVHVVDEPAAIEAPAGVERDLEVEAVRVELLARDADADDEVLARRLAHRGQGLPEESQAAFRRAAVGVASDVGPGTQELRVQVAHAHQDLDAVASRFAHAARAGREAQDEVFDHPHRQRPGHGVEAFVGERGGGQGHAPAAVGGMRQGPPLVIELPEEAAVVLRAEAGQLAQGRYAAVVRRGELRVLPALVRDDLLGLRRQQRDAACHPRPVVGQSALAHPAVLRVPGAVGGEEEPVPEAPALDLEGREQRGEQLAHISARPAGGASPSASR